MITTQPVYYPLYKDHDKFIILVTGGRGCESPTQEVIMSDLTIKRLKDIRKGDYVMGDDGTPRLVVDTMSGRSMMYKVHQTSGEDYLVNDAHILSLKKSRTSINEGRYGDYEELTDMNVIEYANKSNRFREHFRGYKTESIAYAKQDVEIEPYLLGLWLGDGTSIYPQITTPDEEIKNYLQEYACREGMLLTFNGRKGTTETLRLAKKRSHQNPLMTALRNYDLLHNKHIPQEYISNSEDVRLELLAGLLDTDGYMSCNGYEITQKSERLARQIKYVADTLGFRTNITAKKVMLNGKDCGLYYRVHINGDVWRIPCKVKRKQVTKDMCHKNKDWHLSYLAITEEGIGDWCGICLDGNQRYLHSDGTVTHNSGKSFNIGTFIERLTFEAKKKGDGKVLAHNILYTRYTMVSAKISVIPEFLEKIEKDETEGHFYVTQSDVTNIDTGAKIMFRGIHTSSGNQTAKLKSIHGITTFVCDEAEEWTSEKEFETIMFSIRQAGIQNRIIVIMNPTDSNHFIYDKYIKDTHKIVEYDGVPVQISTHPNVLHIHTSYLDNKDNLSEEFLKEAQNIKEKDPDKYGHIFMGRWDDVAEGAVFKKWGVVKDFPENAKKVAVGADWGYTNDVTALVRCGVVEENGVMRLYIDELCYRTQMLARDIVKELRPWGLQVYGDSADPRLIDEIMLGGVLVYPVNKYPGSIKAGIDKMLSVEIYVTERSYNIQKELRNYVWDKDKDGNYINQPIDAYNHALDATRYYVLAKLLGKVLLPKKIDRSKLNIF